MLFPSKCSVTFVSLIGALETLPTVNLSPSTSQEDSPSEFWIALELTHKFKLALVL